MRPQIGRRLICGLHLSGFIDIRSNAFPNSQIIVDEADKPIESFKGGAGAKQARI